MEERLELLHSSEITIVSKGDRDLRLFRNLPPIISIERSVRDHSIPCGQSHGFMPYRSITTAWMSLILHLVIRKSERLYQMDVEKCYDCIKWTDLKFLTKVNRTVPQLIMDFLSTAEYSLDGKVTEAKKEAVAQANGFLKWHGNILRPPEGIGLIQGSPLSPVLCNLILERVENLHLDSVRYADDIIVFSERDMLAIESKLKEISLQCSRKKLVITQILHGQSFQYLGLTATFCSYRGLYVHYKSDWPQCEELIKGTWYVIGY